MIYASLEPTRSAPAQDIVTFSFDKQQDYNDDAPLLIDADNPTCFLTARAYKTLVKKLIAGFLALGLRPGECVLTHLPNSYYYPAIFFSIAGAGGIWCGSNPANKSNEVSHFLRLATPRFIVTQAEHLPTVLDACDKLDMSHKKIFVLDPTSFPQDELSPDLEIPSPLPAGVQSLASLLYHGCHDWLSFKNCSQAKTTPAAYFATSGTTGLPKLAALSHHNLIAHHLSLHEQFPFETRRLMSLPLFHLFAAMFTFIQPIRYFQPTYIMKRFSLGNWLCHVERYQITELCGVPPMLVATLQAEQSGMAVKKLLSSVRYLVVAGAPISAESINVLRNSLHPESTVKNFLGLTEVGPASLFRYGVNDPSGSVGRLVGGVEAKLLDSQGRELASEGKKGELHLKTEGRKLGYVGHSLETSEWWATGDMCEIKDGKLFVVGRSKELIKVRGWQVAPAEIEAVLLQHPDIIDAAVVGVAGSEALGEVPRAYIVRRRSQTPCDGTLEDVKELTAHEVYQFSRAMLASYKALDGGVCFVDSIPRTPSGKIQRRKLAGLREYH